MASSEMTMPSNTTREVASRMWWVLLVQGIATVILGILLFTSPASTLIALAWVLGIFWMVTGIFDIIGALTGRSKNRHWFWSLLGGILGVIVGFLLVSQPLIGAVALPFTMTLLIGIGAIFNGIFNMIGAIMMRQEIEGEFWMFIWGAITLVLGIWVLSNIWVASVAYVWVAAIFAVVGGVIMIINSFRLRNVAS